MQPRLPEESGGADFIREDELFLTKPLRSRLEEWATRAELRPRPRKFSGIRDRVQESIRPQQSVAVAAGGPWLERLETAVRELLDSDSRVEASLGVRLLTDIRSVFAARGATAIFTTELISALEEIDDAPWGEAVFLTPKKLASMLKPYLRKTAQTVRVGANTRKGYEREWFADAWRRFCPVEEAANRHTRHNGSDEPNSGTLEPSQAVESDGSGEVANPHRQSDVTGVTAGTLVDGCRDDCDCVPVREEDREDFGRPLRLVLAETRDDGDDDPVAAELRRGGKPPWA
jgi:hypothetical protein